MSVIQRIPIDDLSRWDVVLDEKIEREDRLLISAADKKSKISCIAGMIISVLGAYCTNSWLPVFGGGGFSLYHAYRVKNSWRANRDISRALQFYKRRFHQSPEEYQRFIARFSQGETKPKLTEEQFYRAIDLHECMKDEEELRRIAGPEFNRKSFEEIQKQIDDLKKEFFLR